MAIVFCRSARRGFRTAYQADGEVLGGHSPRTHAPNKKGWRGMEKSDHVLEKGGSEGSEAPRLDRLIDLNFHLFLIETHYNWHVVTFSYPIIEISNFHIADIEI